MAEPAGLRLAARSQPHLVDSGGGRGQEKQPHDDGATIARQGAVGTTWVLVGLLSYAVLSSVARVALHSPAALTQLQAEVPVSVYDRSLAVFGTAFLLDVLGALFELKTSRLDMVLLPAFVKGAATLTNALVRGAWACVAFSSDGRAVVVQRYVCWLHTTPTILLLVRMISSSITRQQLVRTIVAVEVTLLTGLVASLSSGAAAAVWGVLSHLAFLPVLPFLHQGLTEAAAVINQHAAWPTTQLVYWLTMLMWTGFGVVWDARMLGLVDARTEEAGNLCCDFAAKVVFSAGLMLGAFKGQDSRREVVMRQIQEGHRQTLVTELQAAIRQKDAFMSTVSHELRTPLNGIIGVSEGLLSGCCGVLNEAVRRQIYVVRTSGARLLALINDVMDAAALRQHRLVLQPERFELRRLVGDVVDLTRSLVDNSVSLRNDVPEGLVVWADSGRLIQILNNLLGNAAKFTHHGTIRVSAAFHDEQRQWVAICVADSGIGIPKHKLSSVFLPFTQVDGSISRQYGGFGLGLSITQELVSAHGGELWVRSREHKGSVFTFTLPSFTGQKPRPQSQQQQQQLGALAPDLTSSLSRSRSVNASMALLQQQHEQQQHEQQQQQQEPDAQDAAKQGPAANGVGSGRRRRHSSVISGANGSALLAPSARASSSSLARSSSLDAVSDLAAGSGSSSDDAQHDALDGVQDFARELPYNAAQLAALASRKPFASAQPPGSRSSTSSEGTAVQPPPRPHSVSGRRSAMERDPRHTQFACSGRYRVLSVDDDPVNQTVVQSLLASTGYEVVPLYSGAAALQYIETTPVLPDLILLDVLMPDMSGPEVCRRLASRCPPLGVPIILVSAASEEATIVAGLDSGADDFVRKPFRRAEFLARIRAKLTLSSQPGDGGPAAHAAPSARSQEAPLVLCVGDDEVDHLVLEGMLQSQGYRYLRAATGSEALALLDTAHPRLVLLNAALPDTTGLDVLRALRQRHSQVTLPVIMLTARHNEQPIVEALDAGANDYCIRPFRRPELLARIRLHLRSAHKAAAAAEPNGAMPPGLPPGGADGAAAEQHLPAGGWHAESLAAVPLLVVQLVGLDQAVAAASPQDACRLLGYVADCFDAVAEKYAVVKIELSDTCLTVAAPIMSTGAYSTRMSLQATPAVQQLGGATAAEMTLADVLQAQGAHAGTSASDAASPPSPSQQQHSTAPAAGVHHSMTGNTVADGLVQLLQMAHELAAVLGISCLHAAPGGAAAGSSGAAQGGNGSPGVLDPPASLQAAQPACPPAGPLSPAHVLHGGALHVRVALHVGPLHAAVVGRRRPRYRLVGPALDAARAAAAAAPADSITASAEAAQLLAAAGVAELQPLGGGAVVAASAPQLWRVAANPFAKASSTQAAAGAGGVLATDAILQQAAGVLAPGSPSHSRSGGSSPPAHPWPAVGAAGLAPQQAVPLPFASGQLWNPLVPLAASAPATVAAAAATLGFAGSSFGGAVAQQPPAVAQLHPLSGAAIAAAQPGATSVGPQQPGAVECQQFGRGVPTAIGLLYQELAAMQQQLQQHLAAALTDPLGGAAAARLPCPEQLQKQPLPSSGGHIVVAANDGRQSAGSIRQLFRWRSKSHKH